MIGGFTSHWSYTWQDVWLPLAEADTAPPELLAKLLLNGIIECRKYLQVSVSLFRHQRG